MGEDRTRSCLRERVPAVAAPLSSPYRRESQGQVAVDTVLLVGAGRCVLDSPDLVFLFPVYVGNKKTTNIGKIGLPAVAAPLLLLSSDKRAKHGPYKWGARLALAVMFCSLADSPCVRKYRRVAAPALTPHDSPADTFRLWLTHRVGQMHSRPPRILLSCSLWMSEQENKPYRRARPSCRCPAA